MQSIHSERRRNLCPWRKIHQAQKEHHVFYYLGNPRLFMETQIYVRGVVCTYICIYTYLYDIETLGNLRKKISRRGEKRKGKELE